MMRNTLVAAFLLIFTAINAQVTFPVNGVANEKPIYTALTNANIFTDYQTLVSNATLLIKDDKVEAIGTNIPLPKGTVVYDLQGKYIYPAFIDLYSNYGMPALKPDDYRANQFLSNSKTATGWNQAVKPEVNAIQYFQVDAKTADGLRKAGFGTVLTQHTDGIFRGTSTLVALADAKVNEVIIKDKAATGYSFNKGISTQDYPSSLMGSISLVRQTYYDADWYAKGGSKEEFNLSLNAINEGKKLPAIFEVGDKLTLLRADKVGDEFGVQYIIKGAGDEYQRLDEVKATNAALILPVSFPEAYDVADPLSSSVIQLTDMKHWELAPANAAVIDQAGINFAFTSAGLKEVSGFLRAVRKTMENGLTYKSALKALTYTPATLIGATDKLGDLKAGKLASFIITNDSLFTRSMGIAETWVSGKRYIQEDITLPVLKGTYNATIKADNGKTSAFTLTIKGTPGKPSGDVTADGKHSDIEMYRDANMIVAFGELKNPGFEHKFTTNLFVAKQDKYHATELSGRGSLSDGTGISFTATFVIDTVKAKRDTFKIKKPEGQVWLPFAPYGFTQKPTAGIYHIKNATVWTNEKEGKLEGADVIITNGKITAVGKSLTTPAGATVVDGTGKHVTAGIIDEHSHIAISKGVNEGAQSVTSEVRIGDVVNPDDVNIYRQLSGGVTAAQLLHGSANCIGGQSAIIKLRWGQPAEQMKIASAPGFIKFALGENVKQSNWGDDRTVRFPQTRMGVEQTFADAFIRAKEYNKLWAAYNSTKPKEKGLLAPPRRDLELDALVEILDKKRFITCHSYVQSELNMLMKLGDSLGFKVNTFTHVLEGYKVADKMKARDINASTFADWWAYKFEVLEATPYNAAVLTRMGVNTAINSDDAEMARRLNQEAGKTVKYGNLSEEEALKLVTLNPAKMLHIDDICGSIKAGKDADVVIWNNNPLSIYAKVEKTFVDGLLLYDVDADKKLRQDLKTERIRLMNKMAEAGKKGERTRKPEAKPERFYHCNSFGEEGELGGTENMH